MKNARFIIALVIAFAIGGFVGYLSTNRSPAEPSARTEPVDEPAVASSDLPEETDVPAETATPEPSPTPQPTATPEDTATPRPTSTPRPTNTPRPTPSPTPPPEPIVLTGSGDAIVDLDKPDDPAIVHITGNAANGHFAVISYDAGGNQMELLVNTTDPYDGVRPIDFLEAEHTARFEVKATGSWEINILPFFDMPIASVPGVHQGTGDAVFFLDNPADIAAITGNAAGVHFAVHAYGTSVDLLVNTTEPYDGQVIIPAGARVIAVTAVSDWTMNFTAR